VPEPSTAGFPDASDTGVPPGVALTRVPEDLSSGPGWSWVAKDGCVHVNNAGTVLSDLAVSGCVEIYADNVIVKDSRITVDGDGWAVGVRGFSGIVVQDVTMAPATPGRQMQVGVKDVTGSSSITVLRSDISGWSTGIQMSRGVVQDNYVHDPVLLPGDHINGFTDNGGRDDGTMVVRHNTFLNSVDQTDAISLFQDFGVIQDVVVDDNLLAGGSYSLYAGAGRFGTTNHVSITNNHFSARYSSLGAAFGPVCCFDGAGTGNVWSGNVWADGPLAGTTIPAPGG
jgi:hypothetical protein